MLERVFKNINEISRFQSATLYFVTREENGPYLIKVYNNSVNSSDISEEIRLFQDNQESKHKDNSGNFPEFISSFSLLADKTCISQFGNYQDCVPGHKLKPEWQAMPEPYYVNYLIKCILSFQSRLKEKNLILTSLTIESILLNPISNKCFFFDLTSVKEFSKENNDAFNRSLHDLIQRLAPWVSDIDGTTKSILSYVNDTYSSFIYSTYTKLVNHTNPDLISSSRHNSESVFDVATEFLSQYEDDSWNNSEMY